MTLERATMNAGLAERAAREYVLEPERLAALLQNRLRANRAAQAATLHVFIARPLPRTEPGDRFVSFAYDCHASPVKRCCAARIPR